MSALNSRFCHFIEQETRPHPAQDQFYAIGGNAINDVTFSLQWNELAWTAEWAGSRAKGTNVPWSDGDTIVKPYDSNDSDGDGAKVTKSMRTDFPVRVERALRECGFVNVSSEALFCATRFKYAVTSPGTMGADNINNHTFEIDVTFAQTKFAYPAQLEQGLKAISFIHDPDVKIAIKAFKYFRQCRNLPKIKGIEIEAIALTAYKSHAPSSAYTLFLSTLKLLTRFVDAHKFNQFEPRFANGGVLVERGHIDSISQSCVECLQGDAKTGLECGGTLLVGRMNRRDIFAILEDGGATG
ncbi:hypothetical protein HK102_000841 [Quaeritorhiza haematococci]|nr:hypothetical protein HK102_000841 [Quaeritorhiza haematococci]